MPEENIGVRDIEVENRLTRIETNLNTVMTNHLPHIEKKVNLIIGLVVASAILGRFDIPTLLAYFR